MFRIVLAYLGLLSHAQDQECVTQKTGPEMLGFPKGCNLTDASTCCPGGATKCMAPELSYSTGTLFVICEVSHICILTSEDFMMNEWGVREEQLPGATLAGGCIGFDVSGGLVGQDSHHWMYRFLYFLTCASF